MPILDLQQRLQEVGRIRMGDQQEFERRDGSKGMRPAKLPHWRLTGRDEQRLASVAEVYGGEVKPWEAREGEYEVYTTTDTLRVLIIPGQALSQWWELWSGGGCQRRCDGEHEVLSDGPCLCPKEYDERAEASKANPPKACKPTTRLAVLLPDVPGIGHWRLETHSYYAAVELAGAHGLLEEASRRGALLPARLRIDVRKKVAGGKTTTYPVPVIDLDVTVPQLMGGASLIEGEVAPTEVRQLGAGAPAEGEPGWKPVPAEGRQAQPGVAEGLAAAQQPPPPPAPRANAQEPLGVSTPPPGGAPLPVLDEGDEPAVAPAAAVPEPQAAAPAAEPPPAEPPPAAAAEPPPAAAEPPQEAASSGPEAAGASEPPAAGAAPPAASGATAGLEGTMANQRQRRLLWATVRERSMPEAQLRAILTEVTGQESTASIPSRLFDPVLTAVQGSELWPEDAV